jgi:hypothetical protein
MVTKLIPSHLYPTDVVEIKGPRIAGTAFFPGGSGLYLEGREAANIGFPVRGIMILGHNFDSQCGFKKSLDKGKETLTRGAWAGIIKRLDLAGIPAAECFFTNAFMGLCRGNSNKDFRGRNDSSFREACAAILRAQIRIQRPKLIVTLGLKVLPLLACLSADLHAWRGIRKGNSCDPQLTTKDIDRTPIITARFDFDDGLRYQSVVVPITHPGDERNVKWRQPLGFSNGLDGEAQLMREGLGRTMLVGEWGTSISVDACT